MHGGRNQNCTRLKSIIEGVCDNSQRNGCSSGTPDDGAIDDTDTHYTWLCMGAKGGATATNCQIQKPPIHGACSGGSSQSQENQRNTCSSGTANDGAFADTDTHYGWLCEGSNGGGTVICFKRK